MDHRGQFFDHGVPVEHPAMQVAFRTWIDRHPDDGRYILNNGYDWTYFTVEGSPFRVRGVRVTEAGLLLSLDDGSEELLGREVWLGPQGDLYTSVKRGRFEARFEPSAQASLGDALLECEGGYAVWSPEGPVFVAATPPPARRPG
jgi:hypothetical protein